MKKIVIFILMFLFILCLGIGGYFFFETRNKDTDNNITNENETSIVLGETPLISGTGASSNNGSIKINGGGTYNITGSFSGNIIIDTSSDVIINLNNVTINSTNDAGVVCTKAKSLTINLVEGSKNYINDAGSSDNDAAIYSTAPIIINGTGELVVKGNNEEGIATKSNDITINGGNIHITSKDDGINAGGDGGTITINGGNLYIDAVGDGIDSNKSLIINGGTIFTMSNSTDNGAIDYETTFEITGGTLVALGNGMIVSPTENSTQKTMLFNFSSSLVKEAIVSLMDTDKNEIVTFSIPYTFTTLTVSSPLLAEKTYNLYSGGNYNGTLNYGIYTGGTYSEGTELSINSTTNFSITGINTSFGNSMPGQEFLPNQQQR